MMTRRKLLQTLSASALPRVRPNIVFVLADDLGYGDLSCYRGPLPTPNLDRLAREGVRFTSHYCAAPVCTASRTALYTGQYAQRLGIVDMTGALFPESKVGIPQNAITFADMIRYQGYSTGFVGKWHLGHKLLGFLPTYHGFDKSWFVPYSNDLFPQPYYYGDRFGIQVIGAFDSRPEAFTGEFLTAGKRFISQQQPGKPFFLVFAPTAPHAPHVPSAAFAGKSGLGPYYDVILELDRSVGELVDSLPSDTLVFFTSDNGGVEGVANNGPFRGGKLTTEAGGLCVPMIAWWPGPVTAGRVVGEFTSMLDFMPTLGELAGLKGDDPHLKNPDGVSILPLLLGSAATVERKLALHFRLIDPERASIHYVDPITGERLHLKVWFGGLNDEGVGDLFPYPRVYNTATDPAEQTDIARNLPPELIVDVMTEVRRQLLTFPDATVNPDLVPTEEYIASLAGGK